MAESSGIGSTSNFSGPATDSLRGRVALVTGGSRGIGRAISLELARNGAAVAVNFVSNVAAAEAVAADIRAMGGECLLVQGDVSKKEAARSVVGKILEAWKRIDILVNNAGITRDRTLNKMTDEDWEAVNLGESEWDLLLHRCRNAGHDRAEIRAHHQHCFHRRPNGSVRPIQLCRQQRRHHRVHQVPGAGAGEREHHRQCGCPGVYRYGNGRSDAAQRFSKRFAPRYRCAGWQNPKRSPRRFSSWPGMRITSPERS